MNSEKPKKSSEQTKLDYKSIREEKGFTLQEISQRTRISSSILNAIENRDFHLLPEPVYTRAFIKIYAKTLDTDSDDLLSLYNSYVEEIDASREQEELAKKNARSQSRHKMFVWAGAALFIALFAFLMFFYSNTDTKKSVQAPSPETKTQQEQSGEVDTRPSPQREVTQTTDNQVGEEKTDTQPTTEEQSETRKTEQLDTASTMEQKEPVDTERRETETAIEEKKYVLEIEATELSWLKIIEDDKEPYEILLRPGEKLNRKASERFILFIGNAGGIKINFQGKAIAPLGEHGKVIRLILPGEEESN
ncbi:MAG: helix-turn-helix domain-containing protein [Deltaproteobacteria bacterium]|nr:helix-turn-helix domain-containing protein [Deltaproteobacteria bacterium]